MQCITAKVRWIWRRGVDGDGAKGMLWYKHTWRARRIRLGLRLISKGRNEEESERVFYIYQKGRFVFSSIMSSSLDSLIIFMRHANDDNNICYITTIYITYVYIITMLVKRTCLMRVFNNLPQTLAFDSPDASSYHICFVLVLLSLLIDLIEHRRTLLRFRSG